MAPGPGAHPRGARVHRSDNPRPRNGRGADRPRPLRRGAFRGAAMTAKRYVWQPTTAEIAERFGIDRDRVVRFDQNTSPDPTDWTAPLVPPVLPDLNEYPAASYRPLRESAARYAGVRPGGGGPGCRGRRADHPCCSGLPFARRPRSGVHTDLSALSDRNRTTGGHVRGVVGATARIGSQQPTSPGSASPTIQPEIVCRM